MARNLSEAAAAGASSNPSANNEHNVKARKDAINESLEAMYKLDCKIKAATEKHVKPHRDAVADIKSKLKSDYQITAEVIKARFVPYRLERRAQDAEDWTTLDAIRESFDHLPVGGHVDLVTEAEKATEESQDNAAAAQ